MKRLSVKIISLILAVIMLIGCFAGCSKKGEPLLTIENTEISVNLYMLYLSRMKGLVCAGNSAATGDTFWDTVMSADGATTYNKYYCDMVLENTKMYLAAAYEFDKRGYKLPKSTTDAINAEIKALMEADAEGSKTQFNNILAQYGANYEVLKEAYIIDAKMDYLKNAIYGADGSLIGENLYDAYYQNNYVRFKQIFYYTYDYVYETDGDGKEIYYYTESKKIAYDTSATVKTDKDGKPVKDSMGETIYVNVAEDGTMTVAYDKVNGERKKVIDSDGNYIVKPVGEEELANIVASAEEMYEKVTKIPKDFNTFDNYASDKTEYPNGVYVAKDSNYVSEVIDEVFDMKVGDVRTVRSELGIHILMKYELEDGGYKKNDNSDFFISTETGNFVFLDDLKNQLLAELIKPNIDKITVDTGLLAGVDMKSVAPNFYY